MSTPAFTNLARTIIEFRYDPQLGFFDWRGSLAGHLLEELGLKGYKISSDRIDLTDPDKFDFSVFVTPLNAGIVLEDNADVAVVKEKITSFLNALNSYSSYQLKGVNRVGVRWNLLRRRRDTNFEEIFDSFKNNVINLNVGPYSNFEERMTDVGLPIYFRSEEVNYNIVQGPMKKEQALGMYFNNQFVYFEKSGAAKSSVPKDGFFVDIDVYKENLGKMTIDELRIKIENFIDIGLQKADHLNDVLFSAIL